MTVDEEPSEEKQFTAAEVLDIVLAAFERGYADGQTAIRGEPTTSPPDRPIGWASLIPDEEENA